MNPNGVNPEPIVMELYSGDPINGRKQMGSTGVISPRTKRRYGPLLITGEGSTLNIAINNRGIQRCVLPLNIRILQCHGSLLEGNKWLVTGWHHIEICGIFSKKMQFGMSSSKPPSVDFLLKIYCHFQNPRKHIEKQKNRDSPEIWKDTEWTKKDRTFIFQAPFFFQGG